MLVLFSGLFSACHIFIVVRKLFSKSAVTPIPLHVIFVCLCVSQASALSETFAVSFCQETNKRTRYTRMSRILRVSLVRPSTKLETTRVYNCHNLFMIIFLTSFSGIVSMFGQTTNEVAAFFVLFMFSLKASIKNHVGLT